MGYRNILITSFVIGPNGWDVCPACGLKQTP